MSDIDPSSIMVSLVSRIVYIYIGSRCVVLPFGDIDPGFTRLTLPLDDIDPSFTRLTLPLGVIAPGFTMLTLSLGTIDPCLSC